MPSEKRLITWKQLLSVSTYHKPDECWQMLPKEKTCEWGLVNDEGFKPDYMYKTSCGQIAIKESELSEPYVKTKYCPFCGGKIEEKS